MVSGAKPAPHEIFKHALTTTGVSRADIPLNRGRVSDALRVFHGPCRIYAMFMEITEAVSAGTCTMAWTFRSDAGGYRVIAAASSDIAPSAVGDFYVAELDGTALVTVTTGSGLIHGYWYETTSTNGTIVTPGGIDIVLSSKTLTAGKGTLYVYYKPLINDAVIVAEDLQTSTTTSSTTSSSTSSTSSTASTTSTTSSTSSTASTTSTTSSTSSTASTTSSTSSTSSTASTTSSTSSSSTTSSTTSSSSTASTTSTTSSTTSTTTTWPP